MINLHRIYNLMVHIDHFDIENVHYMIIDLLLFENYQYILHYLFDLFFEHNEKHIFVLKHLWKTKI
jgi:hypothetical protein